jgi:hypothetical protein
MNAEPELQALKKHKYLSLRTLPGSCLMSQVLQTGLAIQLAGMAIQCTRSAAVHQMELCSQTGKMKKWKTNNTGKHGSMF